MIAHANWTLYLFLCSYFFLNSLDQQSVDFFLHENSLLYDSIKNNEITCCFDFWYLTSGNHWKKINMQIINSI